MKTFTFGGFKVELGQSAQENNDIIRRSQQNDIWLHLAAFSGPHAVIHAIEGKKMSNAIIGQAAQQIKDHCSQTKKLREVYVEYTELKNVKLTGKAGFVELSKTPEQIKIKY